ncbi:alpha/beta hydrolase [Alphaproteobacteria bacterium]|nr:alpha/beta hydrolase [Alphaproteobacteria bacterium]
MPEIVINGPEGRLEARYQQSAAPNAPVALILHPHPEYGGTMNNKVTYALFKAFTTMGFNTMRFNFRGIGKSEGSFSDGEGELADAAAVMDWLQAYNKNASAFWVGGFSFGAWIGMQLLMRRPELDGFISVAPPANLFDFSFLAPCPVPGLIVHGEQDTIVPRESVDRLYKERLEPLKSIDVDYQIMPQAGHFFDHELHDLMGRVQKHVKSRSQADTPPQPKSKAA